MKCTCLTDDGESNKKNASMIDGSKCPTSALRTLVQKCTSRQFLLHCYNIIFDRTELPDYSDESRRLRLRVVGAQSIEDSDARTHERRCIGGVHTLGHLLPPQKISRTQTNTERDAVINRDTGTS